MKPLSSTQRDCIIEATIDPLVSFRRGFARDRSGPYFSIATVDGLIKRGALRAFYPARGRRGLQLSARTT